MGCYSGPGADHFVAVADALPIPAQWQLVKSVVRGPDQEAPCDPAFGSSCPGAIRYFLVAADTADVFAKAMAIAVAAGFQVTKTYACRDAQSSPHCSFFAARDSDELFVTVYRSAADVGLDDAPAEMAAVVFTVNRLI